MRTLLVVMGLVYILTFAAVTQSAGQTAAEPLEARRAELTRLLNEQWEYTLRTQPELATQRYRTKPIPVLMASP